MCQRHHIAGVRSGPEPRAAGIGHGTHADGIHRGGVKWKVPGLPFLTKPGALGNEAEAVRRERG